MSAKRASLGRGLDALLGIDDTSLQSEEQDMELSSQQAEGQLRQLPVEILQRGKYQPRKDLHPEALEELSSSIKAQGVMQPIVVRAVGDGRYEIIAGERRWRASQQAGLDTIPALIRDVSDEAAIAMALIENIQREDLNPIEEAQALIRLQEEFELTQQQVADAVGKSRSTVTNLMRLMTLESEVQTLMEHGDLELGHAKCLLGLGGEKQVEAARTVVARSLTVRQTESLVKKYQTPTEKEKTANIEPDKEIIQLEKELNHKMGVPVIIQQNAQGKGKLVLKYEGIDQLKEIIRQLG